MSRTGVVISALAAVSLVVAAIFATTFLLRQPVSEPAILPDTLENTAQTVGGEASEISSSASVIQIKLYVPASSGESLATEDQEIQLLDSAQKQARQVVELLVRRSSSFPTGVELREVFITSQGVAYVDFSSELVQNHPGGSSAEELTVFGLSHTLVANFPAIKRVKILVEGREIETIAGHLDLTIPYGRAPDYLRPESERSEHRNNETS